MDQFKGKYNHGGGRLPPEKYHPTEKYLTKVLGDCPDCGVYLIKKTGRHGEFVGCDNFPNCRFSCSIIEFESLPTSTSNYKPLTIPSKLKIESVVISDEKNKETTINASNEMHNKSTDENINYCINCGFEIYAPDEYCSNCGEKIDKIDNIEEQTEFIEKRSIKQHLFYCKNEVTNEFNLSKIKCTSWIVGILSCLLLTLLICIPNPQEYFIGNFIVCIVGGFIFGIVTFIFSSIIFQIYEERVS